MHYQHVTVINQVNKSQVMKYATLTCPCVGEYIKHEDKMYKVFAVVHQLITEEAATHNNMVIVGVRPAIESNSWGWLL